DADATEKCLDGRAKAKGKYELCVNKWIGHCYSSSSGCAPEALSKCVEKLVASWQKLVKLNDGLCTEPRWVDNGDNTVIDNMTDLVWEKKTDDSSVHDQ